MNKENNQQFETLVLDVAHIIFGDNAPDINVRLVRMALEQVWKTGPSFKRSTPSQKKSRGSSSEKRTPRTSTFAW